MRRAKSLLISLTAAAVVLCFQNCQVTNGDNQGTETGNSFSPTPTSGSPASSPENQVGATVAGSLVSAICTRINACSSAAQLAQCQSVLLAQSSLPQLFGVAANLNILTMQNLSNTEAAGGVAVSTSQVNACLNEIANTPCTNASLQEGYSTATNSYPGIPGLVGQAPDCQTVY